MPLTSCWRNSVTGALWAEAAGEDLLAVPDRDHDRGLGRVAMLVERDRPGDALEAGRRRDQVAQLVLRGLARVAPGLGRGQRGEAGRVLLGELGERLEEHVGGVVGEPADRVGIAA